MITRPGIFFGTSAAVGADHDPSVFELISLFHDDVNYLLG